MEPAGHDNGWGTVRRGQRSEAAGLPLDVAGEGFGTRPPLAVFRVLDFSGSSVYPTRMFGSSDRRRVQGAIPFQPCLPRKADTPPIGSGWIHEIKHDGFRILARRQGDRIRLFTRNGYDFTSRFPKITAAVAALPARSYVVDGEAIVVDRQGL